MKVFYGIVWGGMLSILIWGFLIFLGTFLLSCFPGAKVEDKRQNVPRSYSVYDASYQDYFPVVKHIGRMRGLILKRENR